MNLVRPVCCACLAVSLALSAPAFGAEGNGWQVLYQKDHEADKLSDRLWGGMGASGPSGGSFAGVTGRTASAFDGGWQSYELRLGAGNILRERYFWLLHRLDTAPAFDALRFRCDFMGDATMKNVDLAFTFFGGEGNRLDKSFMGIGVFGGVLRVVSQTGKGSSQEIAEFAPHVWYRLELDVRCDNQAGRLLGTATIHDASRREPTVVEINLPLNPAAIPLKSLKLDKGRRRGTPQVETRFYLDNLELAVHATSEPTSGS
jgi:hypothetical protein